MESDFQVKPTGREYMENKQLTAKHMSITVYMSFYDITLISDFQRALVWKNVLSFTKQNQGVSIWEKSDVLRNTLLQCFSIKDSRLIS